MTAHLGSRVSALLDGQLSAEEAERAWSHVYACHQCRDLVEREGWVKTRLAGFAQGRRPRDNAPDALKGALSGLTPGDMLLALSGRDARQRPRTARVAGLAALGGGAVGAAVVGVLALGAAPADAPAITRNLTPSPTQTISPTPTVRSIPVPVSSRPGH